MMIGRVTPARRMSRHSFAAVHVRQADIEQDRVEAFARHGLQRRARAVALGTGELCLVFELLGERLAQRRIVVDDQYLATAPHFTYPKAR